MLGVEDPKGARCGTYLHKTPSLVGEARVVSRNSRSTVMGFTIEVQGGKATTRRAGESVALRQLRGRRSLGVGERKALGKG